MSILINLIIRSTTIVSLSNILPIKDHTDLVSLKLGDSSCTAVYYGHFRTCPIIKACLVFKRCQGEGQEKVLVDRGGGCKRVLG